MLSAKDDERLRDYAGRLLAFVRAQRGSLSLRDLAYTLQVGREAMPQRLAFQAASFDDVERMLTAFVEQRTPVQGLHVGRVHQHEDSLAAFAADEDMAAAFEAWLAKGKA